MTHAVGAKERLLSLISFFLPLHTVPCVSKNKKQKEEDEKWFLLFRHLVAYRKHLVCFSLVVSHPLIARIALAELFKNCSFNALL